MDGLIFGSSHLLYSRYPLVSFNNGPGYLGGILAVSLARYCGIIIKLAGLSFGKVFNKFATFSWRHDLEHWFNIGGQFYFGHVADKHIKHPKTRLLLMI